MRAKYFVDKRTEAYAWATATRAGLLPTIGAEVEVHEFDYGKTHVVYDHNGVKIASFPAIHICDGAVSYRLDWNGLSLLSSGDTIPSQFYADNAKGADIAIH